MFSVHLVFVEGAELRQAEEQGAEQHVAIVKGKKQTDEDSEKKKKYNECKRILLL